LIKNFIQVSFFLAISLILFVKKSSEELRFCVNYWSLNVMTVKNQYSLLLIQETLNRLTKIKYYIKLDIIAVFNKLRMTYENEWKIAFQTRYDLYEYNVLLFKLTNESSLFQNFINDILHDFLNVFCIAYMNDILIYSNSKKKHTQHVHQILKRLKVVEIQINIEKCEFSVIKIKYLSLIIIIYEIKTKSKWTLRRSMLSWIELHLKTLKMFRAFWALSTFIDDLLRSFSSWLTCWLS